MRPIIVFVTLLATALVLGVALYLKKNLGNMPAPPASPEVAPVPAAVSDRVTSVAPPPAPIPAAPVVTKVLKAEQRQDAIDAETDRLYQWSMDDDSTSLSNILADLTNPEKEIREAAIESAKQFGSTNAIPALKAAVEITDDLQEKVAYLEAADFLTLPELDFGSPGQATPKTPEQIQADGQRRAANEARRLVRWQRNSPHQESQPAPSSPP